ncbi:MAG: Fic family protein [Bacteroidaceae bacterium]|nr:Fic family protein [Bacteroidaceae bacterium]
MKEDIKLKLQQLLAEHKRLGIAEQLDYTKFYLYSIITHSTAIEGSTVTEVEAQLLFDEGITSSKRTINEQNMNLDLRDAYLYGMEWIRAHKPITTEWLITLASKVMARTGSECHCAGGDFSAAKGELRRLNVTAGLGGKSYMSFLKVPMKLEAFCKELNERRSAIRPDDIVAIYELSFWAHFELVTIHPWADGNGRTCRLLMNLLQMEYGVLPTKVLKEDKAEYIQALIDTREEENIEIFIDCMATLHCKHVQYDIANYNESIGDKIGDNPMQIVQIGDKKAAIMAFITDNPGVKASVIADHIGLKASRTRDYLAELVKEGRLTIDGANKNRTYKIANEDK